MTPAHILIAAIVLAIFAWVLWLEITDWLARRRAEQDYYGTRARRRR